MPALATRSLAVALLLSTACGDPEPVTVVREETIPCEALEHVALVAGAGELKIHGGAPKDQVRLVAELTGDAADLDGHVIERTCEDSVLVIRAPKPGEAGRIDLLLVMPMADLEVVHEDGPSWLHDIRGRVAFHDGPGAADVREIGGTTEIMDAGGALSVDTIRAHLVIRGMPDPLNIGFVMGRVDVEDGAGGFSFDWLRSGFGVVTPAGTQAVDGPKPRDPPSPAHGHGHDHDHGHDH